MDSRLQWIYFMFALTLPADLTSFTLTGSLGAATNRPSRGFPTIITAFQNHDIFYPRLFFHLSKILSKPSSTFGSTNLQKKHLLVKHQFNNQLSIKFIECSNQLIKWNNLLATIKLKIHLVGTPKVNHVMRSSVLIFFHR